MAAGKAQARYAALEGQRFVYTQRGRDCAKLTLPALLPPLGSTGNTVLPTPYQGIGARGVNNLASKLLLALLPPNAPFFRMMVNDYALEKMSDSPEFKTELEKALGKYERAVMTEIETSGDRVSVFEALKHLIVTGNVLIYKGVEGLRVFHIDRYVVKRDPMGNVLEIITKESISPEVLDEQTKGRIKAADKDGVQKTLDLYTHVQLKGDMFHVYQEVTGFVIPGSKGSFPKETTPYIALRWTKIDGEDYGRGFVEEYLGDIISLEELTKAVVQGSAAAAKVLFLVDPNGTTRTTDLATAPNGAIRNGNAKDVTVLQMDKHADFRITFDTMRRIEDRLAQSFLLNSSVQRDAERVTAEEIQFMAKELEDALGGVYSILSAEFQLPYVNRVIAMMSKKGLLPKLPKEVVKPSIVTGMEALGRGQDLQKLDLLIKGLGEVLGPQVLQQYVNISDYIKRRATAVGIDPEGLIRTPEEIQAEQQQAQMQSMAQTLGPHAIKAMGDMAKNGPPQPPQQEAA